MFNTFRKLTLIAVAVVALLSLGNSAHAQVKVRSVANSAWAGNEDLTGAPTKLGFAFRADGSVIMIDDVSPGEVKGSWRQDGDQITITFSNCVYQGRVQGDRIIGIAQTLPAGGGSWNFMISYAPIARR